MNYIKKLTKRINKKSLADGSGELYHKYMYAGGYTRGYASTMRLPGIFIQTPPNENVITAARTNFALAASLNSQRTQTCTSQTASKTKVCSTDPDQDDMSYCEN